MNTGIRCAINLCATGGADRSYEDLFAKEVKLRGLAGSFKDSEGEDMMIRLCLSWMPCLISSEVDTCLFYNFQGEECSLASLSLQSATWIC